MATARRALERVRRIALAFPEATERLSHGMPTFFAGDKKTFAMFADHHHGDARTALWFAAPPGAQEALVATDRYFRPPYVGYRGWVGIALDGHTDWKELDGLLRDAYVHVAPRKLGALLAR
jgi:hypothetical protein